MTTLNPALPRPALVPTTLVVTRRALLRFLRTPQLIVMATVQMSLFFLIYRYMFGGGSRIAGTRYVDFLVPRFIGTSVSPGPGRELRHPNCVWKY